MERGHREGCLAGVVAALDLVDDPLREVRHVRACPAELGPQDGRVGVGRADGRSKVPEGVRPDLAVVVDRAVEVARVLQVSVEPAEAVGRARGVGDRIPVGDAGGIAGRAGKTELELKA